ncbi:sugar ABC transporter permease [Gordoniibacillus kamchatkensis]|uniref:Sugar ABC transporter permease n=1 Tax=Gordoniibacillus kamchatkensis TaxID=1590651 RepID=A0ABR5AI58_9BACL|nr:ABC transporter permease subunit [Paenibacillus sp. VKM B-2647]KIL40740.1 sugar ABC transporter permease [Paenibacillus sp. VKM B-2647]
MTHKPVRRSLFSDFRKQKYLFILLLPGTLYLLVNNYLPMIGTIIAFKKVNYVKGIFGSPWVGFDNFKFLFTTTDAYVITRNTVLYNLVFIALGLLFAVAFAVLLNEIRIRFVAKFFQSALFFPHFLSFVVVGYLVYSLLSIENGFVNKHLLSVLGKDPINWYNEPNYWPFILTSVHLWKSVGYGTVIYLAAIVGVDASYYEAALIDGASKWKQFTNVTLPSLVPIITILTLMSIGHIFYADFGLFYQVPLNSGMLYPTTLVIDTYVYNILTSPLHGDLGMATAAGLYQSLVGFVLVLLSNGLIRKINKENALF